MCLILCLTACDDDSIPVSELEVQTDADPDPSPSPAVPIPPECGNGEQEDDERCDDGNDLDGDGCNAACELSGQELWRVTIPTQASSVLPLEPLVTTAGDVVVPTTTDPAGASVTAFYRFASDGELINVIEPQLFPGWHAGFSVGAYILTSAGHLLVTAAAEDEDSQRVIRIDLDGTVVAYGSVTFDGGPVAVATMASSGSIMAFVARGGEGLEVAFAPEDASAWDLSAVASLPDGVVPGAIWRGWGALIYGGMSGPGTGMITPATWMVGTDGSVEQEFSPTPGGGDDNWFVGAATSGTEVLLVAEDDTVWRLGDLEPIEGLRSDAVAVTPEGSWLITPNQGAVHKLSEDLLPSYATMPVKEIDGRAAAALGLDIIVSERVVGTEMSELVRYGP